MKLSRRLEKWIRGKDADPGEATPDGNTGRPRQRFTTPVPLILKLCFVLSLVFMVAAILFGPDRASRYCDCPYRDQQREQARSSVTEREALQLQEGFERRIFDSHSLWLRFAGLSQVAEAGLNDQVNRLCLAAFGSAGAVGVIAGLTLRNTKTFSFNMPAGKGARLETGQSKEGVDAAAEPAAEVAPR